MKKLTVITAKGGRVVATQLGHGWHLDKKSGIRSRIVAGPGRKKHEIEMDIPDSFNSHEEVKRFHDRVRKHLAKAAKTAKR